MTFNEYQERSRATVVYPDPGRNYIYPTLGLAAEAGGVANKIKKVGRDKGGVMDDATRSAVKKELGDVLWYVAQLSTELGFSMDEVAASNLENLYARKERGTLHGNGDDR